MKIDKWLCNSFRYSSLSKKWRNSFYRWKLKSNWRKSREITANKITYKKIPNTIEAEGEVRIEDEINDYVILSDTAVYQRNEEIVFTDGNSKAIDGKSREITANKITYKKIPNTIEAEGEVRIEDEINDYVILSDTAVYQRNEEIVFTDGNSKAIDGKSREITANKITYKKIPNTIEAEGEVRIEDEINDYKIFSEKITYFILDEILQTNGLTEGKIISKYNFKSRDVYFNFRSKKLSSKSKSIINDQNNQMYYVDEFDYYINDELLKGKEIITITNYNLPNSDKFYFSNGVFNLKTKEFIAKDTEINIHKNIFAKSDNDPRIYGVSAEGAENKISIKKAIFTSCAKEKVVHHGQSNLKKFYMTRKKTN